MLLFIPKNIFAYSCCIYRTVFRMREHLVPLHSTTFHYIRSLSIHLNFYHRTCGTGKKTSFEVCMLFCFNICRSITFIMYNFSLGFSMYIFILQADDDVILKQFIDLETLHYFGCYTVHCSCRGGSCFQLLGMCDKS